MTALREPPDELTPADFADDDPDTTGDYAWTDASALWQVRYGQPGTPRTLAAWVYVERALERAANPPEQICRVCKFPVGDLCWECA